MNKLFKGLICYTIAICCHILCFAHSATENDSHLSVKLSPEKEIYYIGETVEVIITLKIDEENAEFENIQFSGLNNLPYANVSKIYHDASQNADGAVFIAPLTFTDEANDKLNIEATYRYSIRDTRGNGFFVMKTMGPIKHAKAISKDFIVQNLPTPPVEPFTGFIGRVQMHSSLSTNIAAVGDIITVSTFISTSDISQKDINPCSIEHIDGFKLYPAKIIDQDKNEFKSNYLIEQSIVPNALGEYTIPSPQVFSFDTIDGTYKQVTDNTPLKITIVERKTEVIEDIILDPAALIDGTKTNTTEGAVKPIDPATKKCFTNMDTTAKLAPASTALTIFDIPANSKITILEQHGGWCRISFGNAYGWIPFSAISIGEQ